MEKILLCILDGVGIREEVHGNAVKKASMPTFNMLLEKYPNSLLDASGESVGLPKGQMGNSEVGHSNIGSGRIVYQPLEIINRAIDDKSFFKNKDILDAINHVKKNNSSLHICGLLSDGRVHSDINHLFSLIDMCKINNVSRVYYHVFLDGRDTSIDSGINYINMLKDKINDVFLGSIASISGRYYAMDRDNRYERIEKAYDVMVNGKGNHIDNIDKYILDSYDKGIYDEFIEPVIVNKDGMINDNDGVIVFNYRPDRLRELFSLISNNLNGLKMVTMFPVSSEVKCTNSFNKIDLSNTLGSYLESKNKTQLRIAETEKYAHVTYFFDGGMDIDFMGKDQVLIPSPKVDTYDLKPEMSAYEITDELLNRMNNKYDLIVLNFANGDMVGHTGNMDATVEALESVDKCLSRIYDKCLELGYTLIVTADHGNSDYMLDSDNNIVTTHSTSKVPFIIVKEGLVVNDGKLADIAPTLLKLMDLDIPNDMTGNILF